MTTLTPTTVTERLLAPATGTWRARISVTEPGIAAGVERTAREHGTALVADGTRVTSGTPLLELFGPATAVAAAEDLLLGDLGVACGVATRAALVASSAPDGLRIVCGGWKKLPAAMKGAVRDGLAAAPVAPRLVDGDFVYVGKNAVSMLGSIEAATAAARALGSGPVAVQVTTAPEALVAARAGAEIVMVDSGRIDDLRASDQALRAADLRAAVRLAFGGGATAGDLPELAAAGADIVDVGRAILAHPLLDLRFEVVGRA